MSVFPRIVVADFNGNSNFAGKAYLKLTLLVKTPMHKYMEVARSGQLMGSWHWS